MTPADQPQRGDALRAMLYHIEKNTEKESFHEKP